MATSKDFRVKNGLVVEQDILFGGTLKDLTGTAITLSGTSSDTYTVKDALILQQSETPIGTVVSKTIIPATTQYVEYISNQSGTTTTNPTYSVLGFQYAYFYSGYADIYSPATNTKIVELFATGNTVRITKDGYWWDLSIAGNGGTGSSTYFRPNYNVISTNSPWTYPDQYSSYWDWNQNISFSSNLPVAQKYSLNLSAPAVALTSGNKLLLNGSQTGTPFASTVTSIGTWDFGINSTGSGNPNEYIVDFGSTNYNSNTQNLRDLLQVGTTVTLSDNNWYTSGVYLVTAVGTESTWNTANGIRVIFQYVSGTNYPNSYTNLGSIFSSFFLSASGTVTPNYTTAYLSDFATAVGSSYISFNDYTYINVGSTISYIPSTTAVQFKDDAGNNIKAITYNNSTSEMTYEGIVQSTFINDAGNSLYSSNYDPAVTVKEFSVALGKSSKIGSSSSVAIGYNSQAQESSVALGRDSNANSVYGVAIGYNCAATSFGVALGSFSYAGDNCIAMGYNVSTSSYSIGLLGNANGSAAIAIGRGSNSNHPSQITFAASESVTYVNQTTTFSWADRNLTRNGATYLYAFNGYSSSTQSTTSTSSTYAVDVCQRFVRNQRSLMLGTATILIKPTLDQNNDDTKIIEMKMVLRSVATNNFILEPISTTTIFAGTGTLHPNWTPTFELIDNRYLHFKFDKGADTTALGISCKLEFQVLHTN